jgi:uncharacterized protein YcbK (DUF882 family)
VTQHFQPAEFACPHCHESFVRPLLLQRLEMLRRRVGHPLVIVSGYRCPVHNHQVNGAKNSQHVYGAAADLREGAASLSDARACGFTGIGTRGRWATHVDVRDGGYVTWAYDAKH